jgi:hypothetical protein
LSSNELIIYRPSPGPSIKNPQDYSQNIVEEARNPMENKWMAKSRGQINFSKELKDRFDIECERRGLKPAQLASSIIEWWLRQPSYVQSLALNGFAAIPAAALPAVIAALSDHFTQESTRHAAAGAAEPPPGVAAAVEAAVQRGSDQQRPQRRRAGQSAGRNQAG